MWIKDVLMSCRRATKLLEKKELVPLRPVENIELRIHLFACKYCSEYHKQQKVINDLMEESNLKSSKGLDPLFKAKMQILINRNFGESKLK
jgi:hypothetical protein